MATEVIIKNLVNNFLEHVIVLNADKKISFQTEDICALLGFDANEIEHLSVSHLFINPNFSLDDVLTKAKKYGEFIGTENLKHKTKNYINVAYRLYYEEDEASDTSYYIFYLRDNTQQNLIRKDIIKKSLTIERLSKSRKIREGKVAEAVFEILESSSRAMNTARLNAWVFDAKKTEIQCIGNFDARENKLVPQTSLPRIALPKYFHLFETEKIIMTSDTFNEPKTAELLELYLKPHDIQSLMDIPVRIEGEMIGVICFEHVGSPREWTLQEQKYGLVVAQMLSLTIETHNKIVAKQALEVSLAEQSILMQEVHHRVKNNLSIVASLMNLQADKSHDEYHKQLFMECKNRLESIVTVHELIYKAKSYTQLNFKDYLNQIIKHISSSYSSIKNVRIEKDIKDVHIDISTAVSLALIVNELITNAYKHAFNMIKEGVVEISLFENKKQVFLTIKDNGSGFDKTVVSKNSIGMNILNGLVEQISGTYQLTSNEKGTLYKISFSKK